MRKKDCIKACGRTINYEIIYSKKRRKAAVIVHPDARVEFRAPRGLSSESIREMVRGKAGWICKKLDWFKANKLPDPNKQYSAGEMYLYFGKEYPLNIIPTECVKKPFASFEKSELKVIAPKEPSKDTLPLLVKKAIWDFYSRRADEETQRILKHYSKKLGIDTPVFKVKYQKKRWGSCSADNILRINFQLIMAPYTQFEYVVVHELCHMKEKNHSAKFWKLVKELMPDYEEHRKNLKKDGWRYVL